MNQILRFITQVMDKGCMLGISGRLGQAGRRDQGVRLCKSVFTELSLHPKGQEEAHEHMSEAGTCCERRFWGKDGWEGLRSKARGRAMRQETLL